MERQVRNDDGAMGKWQVTVNHVYRRRHSEPELCVREFYEPVLDPGRVPRSPTGVFLCGERWGLKNTCRMGILAAPTPNESHQSAPPALPGGGPTPPTLADAALVKSADVKPSGVIVY